MLSEAETKRIQDCVNGCQGIGNPLALNELINALANLIDLWANGRPVPPDAPEVEGLRQALQALQFSPPPDEER